MREKILILGASYGSLLGTKCLMAGHDVTLVCRTATAETINRDGTVVRLRLKGDDAFTQIRSGDQPGHVDAKTPEAVDPSAYSLVVLAMQEPQYLSHSIRTLLIRIAEARVPCLSLMNMPPLPYLKRFSAIDPAVVARAYSDASVWDRFEPGLMSLCSPDPQAVRPPDEPANVLQVNLPTNFKAAVFEAPEHNEMLRRIEASIDAVRIDGRDVPVKLKVHDSLFVPFAKWSMLLTGNYRCVLPDGVRPIREAVHSDLELSRSIYGFVDALVVRLGADADNLVPFEKYAKAAEGLVKPSSAARAIAAGAPMIERVDRLVFEVGRALGMQNDEIDRVVATVDQAIAGNQRQVA